jgi:hypothetical protein
VITPDIDAVIARLLGPFYRQAVREVMVGHDVSRERMNAEVLPAVAPVFNEIWRRTDACFRAAAKQRAAELCRAGMPAEQAVDAALRETAAEFELHLAAPLSEARK